MFAIYDGLIFKTHLEARWAAFFDLAGWAWRSNPAPVGDWLPDFRVEFPCGHSECGDKHVLLVAVVQADEVARLKYHPSQKHLYGINNELVPTVRGQAIHNGIDAGAAFGDNPDVSTWQFSHGAGGGAFSVTEWVPNAWQLWAATATRVLSAMV